tara:strand:- start:2251 stop:2685 length:435 start_codon:yes stop_codon:yes gene_type:complete
MPTTSPQIWPVSTGTLTTALTTSFVAPIAINILNNPIQPVPGTTPPTSGKFFFKLSAIYIHVHAIAAGATKLTIRVSPDVTADEMIVPDTQATIATGYTNATRGGVVFKVDALVYLDNPTFYVTVKTDAGTCNLKYVNLIMEKN